MGLFDLPAPLFAALDRGMLGLGLPAALRLVLWAALAGAGTLLLYRLLSPQTAIGQAKREAREARQALAEFDGEMDEAGVLLRRQFSAAFRHLGLVILPTLISLLPLLALLSWLEQSYSRDYPAASEAPSMKVTPDSLQAEWLAEGDFPLIRIHDPDEALDIPLTAPIPVIEQRRWWNWLIANPLGYLPPDRPVQRVEIELPERAYLPFGPPWMRSWLALMLPSMLLVSLLTYRWARIQ